LPAECGIFLFNQKGCEENSKTRAIRGDSLGLVDIPSKEAKRRTKGEIGKRARSWREIIFAKCMVADVQPL
jgi:hypothetical protein